MQITGLFHVAIKTNDLDATGKFYTDVLGMKLAHRPDFGFPGAGLGPAHGTPNIHHDTGGPPRRAGGRCVKGARPPNPPAARSTCPKSRSAPRRPRRRSFIGAACLRPHPEEP